MSHRIRPLLVLLALAPWLVQAASAPDNRAAQPATAADEETALTLSGNWYTTEVIIFERPTLAASANDELLFIARPRRFPAGLQSFERPGTNSAVSYPAARSDSMCLAVSAGSAADATGTVPEAFRKPPRPLPDPVQPGADAPASSADPAPEPPDPREPILDALRAYEAGLESDRQIWLPQSAWSLNREARRLSEAGGFRILFHQAWNDNLTTRSRAADILIQTGTLEGTLRLHRSRGLRLEALLWYGAMATPGGELEYMELREERRLGDGQLNYLDHPKIGVIVQTTPVAVPTELLDAWAALNPPAE